MNNDNLSYCGSFSTIQTGRKTMMNYGETTYSEKQKELYSRALVGLNAYPEEEVYAMNSTKKGRIRKVHKRAQRVLNAFKQKRTRELLDNQVNKIMPGLKKDTLLYKILSTEIFEDTHRNTLSLKDLSISKSDIIKVWVDNNVLPKNYYSL